MNFTRPVALLAGSVLTATLALTAAPASGQGGDDGRIIKRGTCSGSANWKLKVKSGDGRLEVEGEVDSNKSGQSWKWTIKDNGKAAARGTTKTRGQSGSFSVERRIKDRSGTDKVVFKAKHAGEVCKGVIRFG